MPLRLRRQHNLIATSRRCSSHQWILMLDVRVDVKPPRQNLWLLAANVCEYIRKAIGPYRKCQYLAPDTERLPLDRLLNLRRQNEGDERYVHRCLRGLGGGLSITFSCTENSTSVI